MVAIGLRWIRSTVLFRVSIEVSKILKYNLFSKKALVLSIIYSKCKNEDERIFREKESIEILKILGLIENTSLLWKCVWRKHKPRI